MTKIAVAFGGGGIRSIAHIGAVIALEEMGYSIVETAGTSGGAIVASLVARGYTGEEIKKIAYKMNWLSLLRLKSILHKLFVDRPQIMPCKIVYTDIIHGDSLHEGPTVGAVTKSCNVPGLPAIDKRITDGCIYNNLPTNLLQYKGLKKGFNVIARGPVPLPGYMHQIARIIDIYSLANMPIENTIDLVPKWIDPFKSSAKIYDKLIFDAYTRTKEALCDSETLDYFY